MPTLILDTNVWTYIAKADEGDALRALARGNDIEVVVPPSMLMEALKTRDLSIRRMIVRAMTAPGWTHPPTEALQEAVEFVLEVRRCRPEWCRSHVNEDRVAALSRFWTEKIWKAARRAPERWAEAHHSVENQASQAVLDVQTHNRDALTGKQLEAGLLDRFVDTEDLPEAFRNAAPGTRAELWRFVNEQYYWTNLVHFLGRRRAGAVEDTSVLDWIEPYLDVDRISVDRESFIRFWLLEVARENVPRNWMRWAVEHAQLRRKLALSNGVDSQHTSYLFGIDYFATADKRFIDALDTVRRVSPRPFADTWRIIEQDGPIVPQLERLLAARDPR